MNLDRAIPYYLLAWGELEQYLKAFEERPAFDHEPVERGRPNA
jgi:hypothetical protein